MSDLPKEIEEALDGYASELIAFAMADDDADGLGANRRGTALRSAIASALASARREGAERARRDDAEDVARLINGLVEAGDLLMLHVQRIEWNPRAADMARECWIESRAALSGEER